METHGWRQSDKITLGAGVTTVWRLKLTPGVVDGLSIWALSGKRSLTGLSFQMRVNEVNFGAAYAHAGPGVLNNLVISVVDAGTGAVIFIPPLAGALTGVGAAGATEPDPLIVDVAITSTAGVDQVVTMSAAARAHGA